MPLAQAQVNRPAEVILAMDDSNTWANLVADPAIIGSNAINLAVQNNVAPHLSGGNAVYADGHAKWQTLGNLQALGTSATKCTLTAPVSTLPHCSVNWNPFLP